MSVVFRLPAHRARLALAVAVALALIAGIWGPAAQAAPDTPDDPLWTAKQEKSVPGQNAKIVPRGVDPAAQRAVKARPAVRWPAAGGVAEARALSAEVESLGRHGDALWLRVGNTPKAAKTQLKVRYQDFRHAFGGDWAHRLQVVALPSRAPVPTRNDGSGELTAQVAPGLYAVQALAAGGTGDFKASALSPTATWQVGGSSGDFNWQYPMSVPPSTGGPAPKLSLDYSSGGVDGRTSTTNNQPSWVGQGFDLQPGGSIERRYASCGSKTEQSGNNGTRATGDLCFATDNATFTLNGKGGELVRDDATGVWRPRNDDGSRVERLTGAENGDNEGEYWRLTSKDGTQYYFGLNKLPGATTQRSQSGWTVPVFGNHAGEPCHQSTFANSWCQQIYKWNLDYVVDRHGNTMSLFYDIETNNYARNQTATTVSNYVRAGNITRIEYGQRDGQVFSTPAVGRVRFETVPRCIPGSPCTAAADFPDVPLDQECNSTTNCDNKFNPTFWTKKRLSKVTTEVARGTTFTPVSTWTTRHSFPDNGDGTQPGLWLEGITNAGHVGGALAIPEVNFDGVQLPNRVDPVGDGLPVMNWWRIESVHYGTGGLLKVAYAPADCKPGDLPAPDTNDRRCHPMKWTRPGSTTERTDWFHKHVVNQVTEQDRVSAEEPVVTTVEYPRPPAWRHDDEDGLVEIGQKTWSQWRGYDLVIVKKGNPGGPQVVNESRYYRGMDGDKLSGGGVKDVKITDSTGGQTDDLPPLAGQLREQRTLNGAQLVQRTITDQWVSSPTATRTRSWGTTSAFQTEQGGNKQAEALAGGGLRQSSANNNYDAEGVLLSRNDLNDLATPADDTCTYYEYTKNAALGIDEMAKRERTVSVACGAPFTNQQVTADTRMYYDNATSVGTPPAKGDVTKTERLSGFAPDGTPQYQTLSTARYDALGRAVEMRDAQNRASTTTYTPAAGGPVTQTVVTKPNGHTTTVELEPAWGEQVAITDEAGKRTEAAYDPLGRTDQVWWPGRTGTASSFAATGANVAGRAATADNAEVPNVDYDYAIRADRPNLVTTRTLQTDGSIETVYELTDGLMRPRQIQEAAPGGGRIVHDMRYDSRGLEIKENGPFFNDAPPVDEVLIPVEESLPTQKRTEYDLAGRPTAEIFVSENVERWRTTHAYDGDRETVDPPTGDQPTTKISDVQGRITELRQYTGDSASGAYDSTSYAYNRAGLLSSITDPAGNRWTFEYDLLTDPDGRSWFSSIVSSIKTVATTVVNRVVDTVKEAVKVVTPVINWVVDQATKVVEAVKTVVTKTVEVVKKVVKTVKTVVKKAVKTVTKVAKYVAKKAVAKVKSAVKQIGKVAKAVAHKVAAVAQKAAKWVYEHRHQILMVVAEIALTVAIGAVTGGVGALAVRGLITAARMAASAKRLHSVSNAGKALTKYDADFAMGQVTRGGRATASQMEKFGKAQQGWSRSQTANGPAKFTDANGVARLTIKRGSGRAPGSGSPHVEMRNAAGQRMDPYGNIVTRKSPGNHTPIKWDLP